MKKQLIMSLIAALMMTLGVNAQEENTYNMVIKMADGTSITIGPNEIDKVTFNDGAVVVSGTKIDEMMEEIQKNRAMNEENRAMNEEQYELLFNQLHNLIKGIKGDAQLIDSETDEPYTYSGWEYEDGRWQEVTKPATMEYIWQNTKDVGMMIEKLKAHLEALEDRLSALEDRVSGQ